jgi:hypothetical protein
VEAFMAILTLTGQHGSRYAEIGRAVAEDLGFEYIDRQKMLEGLGEQGDQWSERGKDFDSHCPTIWERFDWSYTAFKALLQSVYLDFATKDKIVLIGRGGNFLLKDVPYALKVRIVAPKDFRIDTVINEEDVSNETADWLVDKADHADSCYVHALYGRHADDPGEFDITFDRSLLSADTIVSQIRAIIGEKERANTVDARQSLAMLALAARIKAAIFSDNRFFVPTLEILPEGPGLVVRGLVHNPDERKALAEEITRLAGPVTVAIKFHYR